MAADLRLLLGSTLPSAAVQERAKLKQQALRSEQQVYLMLFYTQRAFEIHAQCEGVFRNHSPFRIPTPALRHLTVWLRASKAGHPKRDFH